MHRDGEPDRLAAGAALGDGRVAYEAGVGAGGNGVGAVAPGCCNRTRANPFLCRLMPPGRPASRSVGSLPAAIEEPCRCWTATRERNAGTPGVDLERNHRARHP